MTKANAFQQLGTAAIKVLARLEARKAAKEQFRQRGIRDYRHIELLQQAREYLAAHPELYEVALARAWQMGMDRERINEAAFDDDRRVWRSLAHLLPEQITTVRALKSLGFSVQLLRFSGPCVLITY